MKRYRSRIRQHLLLNADDIEPHPLRWRNHNEQTRALLDEILAAIGFVDEVKVVQQPNGKYLLLDGHLRRDLSAQQKIPAVVLDLNEREQLLLLMLLGVTAEMAVGNSRVLEDIMSQLPTLSPIIAEAIVKKTASCPDFFFKTESVSANVPAPVGVPVVIYCPIQFREWFRRQLPDGPEYIIAEKVQDVILSMRNRDCNRGISATCDLTPLKNKLPNANC